MWARTPREEEVLVDLPEKTTQPTEYAVPASGGLVVAVSVRPVLTHSTESGLPAGTRSVSVFLVNRRTPKPDDLRDEAFVFQAQLDIHGDRPFVPRPDLRSLESHDWDERVADLQYRDTCECAVGHNIATEAIINDARECWTVRTCWIPHAEVERVAPAQITGVELSMDALGQLANAAAAHAQLGAFVTQYRAWITNQQHAIPATPPDVVRWLKRCCTVPALPQTVSSTACSAWQTRWCSTRFVSPIAPWLRPLGSASDSPPHELLTTNHYPLPSVATIPVGLPADEPARDCPARGQRP